jgi:hypothetical protein
MLPRSSIRRLCGHESRIKNRQQSPGSHGIAIWHGKIQQQSKNVGREHINGSARQYSDKRPTRALSSAGGPQKPEIEPSAIGLNGLTLSGKLQILNCESCTQLILIGCGKIQRKLETEIGSKKRLAKISSAVRTILECIGEDPEREGLLDTPERYGKPLLFFTQGYKQNLRTIVNGAVFREDFEGIVVVKDLDFFSLCEHHLVPFFGKVRCNSPFAGVHMLIATGSCRIYP